MKTDVDWNLCRKVPLSEGRVEEGELQVSLPMFLLVLPGLVCLCIACHLIDKEDS